MKFESLKNGKFNALTKEELTAINGGWTSLYPESAGMCVTLSNAQNMAGTGDYGYPSFLGIRTGPNQLRITDTGSDVGYHNPRTDSIYGM